MIKNNDSYCESYANGLSPNTSNNLFISAFFCMKSYLMFNAFTEYRMLRIFETIKAQYKYILFSTQTEFYSSEGSKDIQRFSYETKR